jgi:hypothetical protein
MRQLVRHLRLAGSIGLLLLVGVGLVKTGVAAEPEVSIWTPEGVSQPVSLTTESLQRSDLWQLSVRSSGSRAARPRFWLHLPGGGRLGIQNLKWDQETLRFQLALSGQELELDAGAIAGVQPVRREASWRTDETEWFRVASCQEAEDLVLLKNGDRQTGEILQVSEESLQLKNELGSRDLAWSSIAGLRMNPELTEPPAKGQDRWAVQLADESWCLAKELALDGEEWQLTLTNSLKLTLPKPAVVWLAPMDTNRVSLSRLVVAEQSHQPLFGEPGLTAATDRNLLGLPLRRTSGSESLPALSALGYGLCSGMKLQWKLDQQYERLVCEVGLDAVAEETGDAIVRFSTEGQLQRELHVEVGQPPVRVNVSLREATNLEIEVVPGEHGDLGDLVDLFHPVLFRKSR